MLVRVRGGELNLEWPIITHTTHVISCFSHTNSMNTDKIRRERERESERASQSLVQVPMCVCTVRSTEAGAAMALCWVYILEMEYRVSM